MQVRNYYSSRFTVTVLASIMFPLATVTSATTSSYSDVEDVGTRYAETKMLRGEVISQANRARALFLH